MVKELIEKLHNIDEKIKSFINKKEEIVEELLNHGYYINEQGKVVENKKTVGLFWNFDYCSNYVSELGMLMTKSSGAAEISHEQLRQIEELFKTQNFKEVSVLLSKITKMKGSVLENTLEEGHVNDEGYEEGYFGDDEFTPFQLDDTLLFKWETSEYGDYQGEMDYESKLEIRETLAKDIQDTPFVYKENVLGY